MKTKNVRGVLRGISASYRKRIRAGYLAKGGAFKYLNNDLRGLLAEAIFEVENESEYRLGSKDPRIVALRSARNDLYDDLGWNEERKVA